MREHQYFVYIMSSNSGTLYVGMTNSIYRRALQHKSGEIDGFSSKYHCHRLVYFESYDDVLMGDNHTSRATTIRIPDQRQ
jgi:putative endonuclease